MKPSRRDFLKITGATIGGLSLHDALAKEQGVDWLQYVHPDLRGFPPLPAEENAYTVWATIDPEALDDSALEKDPEQNELFELLVSPYDFEDRFDWETDELPPGRVREQLVRWIESKRPVLETIDAGVARGRCQLPAPHKEDGMLSLSVFHAATNLKLFRVKLAGSERDFAAARNDLIWLLRVCDLLRGWFYFSDLLSISVEEPTLRVIRWLAGKKDLPVSILKTINVPAIRRRSLTHTCRNDFARSSLPFILDMPDAGTPEQLAKGLTVGLPENDLVRKARDQISLLLSGHPRAFDKQETLRLFSKYAMKFVRDTEFPWRKRDQHPDLDLFPELAVWPGQLNPIDLAVRSLPDLPSDEPEDDDDDDHVEDLEDEEEREDPPKTLTAEELKKAQSDLRAINNPVGKLMVRLSFGMFGGIWKILREQVTKSHAERAATRTILAIRIYERRHGELPESFVVLVEEGLLETLPADPFGDGSLGYSQARRVLWSVGADGKGDGVVDKSEDEEVVEDEVEDDEESGADEAGCDFDFSDELIWKIPPLA